MKGRAAVPVIGRKFLKGTERPRFDAMVLSCRYVKWLWCLDEMRDELN